MAQPIRLGLIGCGGIARLNHIPVYQALPDLIQVVALADLLPENLARIGELLEVPANQRYQDYRTLLAKADLDAVMIATPHSAHAEQVIAAAEAGVAIISEKPMATSLVEADAILAAVERANVPYAVVHNLLFTPPMQAALAELRSGNLGQPHMGRGQLLALKPADLSANYRDPAQAWRATKTAGGGCIIDTSYHEIYSVEALMGSPIRYVEGRVKTMLFDIDVDDLALMLFEHENGAVSTVSASWCAPAMSAESGRWCEVHAPHGSLRVHHRKDEPLWRHQRDGGWTQMDAPGQAEAAAQGAPGLVGHAGFFAATFTALANGAAMPVTGEMARHNLAIIEAARRASEERRAIEVN